MPKSKSKRKCKSGFTGVVNNGKKGSQYKKFVARIYIDQKPKHIGSYNTAKEAAEAYDKEAIKLRRRFNQLNFPKKAPVGYTPIQKALLSTNTVGYRGVYKTSRGERFAASIHIDRKKTHIGTYNTADEAAIAYDRAIYKSNQSKTFLNFPDMIHNFDVEPKWEKQKLRTNNTSGYKGVKGLSKIKSTGKFVANITTQGKNRNLGTFDTAIDAALAYDQAAIKNGNKSHTLNFPDGLPIKDKETILVSPIHTEESAKDGGYLVEGFIIQPLI